MVRTRTADSASAKKSEEEQGPRYTSSSGVTTPQASDLSDSAFDYDVERNWSVIFSDDNYSTDHDIRSNFSSSSEELHASNQLTGRSDTSGVVFKTEAKTLPEADSGSSASPIKNKRNDKSHVSTLNTHHEEVDNSVTTLKEPNSTEGSFTFPDPIKVEKRDLEQKKVVTNENLNFDKSKLRLPSGQVINIVLALLLVFIAEIGRVYISNDENSIVSALFPNIKSHEESISTLTIIRYSTKTETKLFPRETVYVEATVPYETVISEPENYNEEVVHRRESLDLIYDLFSNWKGDLDDAWNVFRDQTTKAVHRASENSKSILQQAKDHDYQESYNKFSSKVDALWKDSFGPTSDFLTDKLFDFEDKVKVTYYSTAEEIKDFDYEGNFQAAKHSVMNTWQMLKDQSSNAYDAADSSGYFDFLKKVGKGEIDVGVSLKDVKEVLSSSTIETWGIFKTKLHLFDETKETAEELKNILSEKVHRWGISYYNAVQSCFKSREKDQTYSFKRLLTKFKQSNNFKKATFASKQHASKLESFYFNWFKS